MMPLKQFYLWSILYGLIAKLWNECPLPEIVIDFMTIFTLGRFQGYLFRYFSIARIKMKISPFIFKSWLSFLGGIPLIADS